MSQDSDSGEFLSANGDDVPFPAGPPPPLPPRRAGPPPPLPPRRAGPPPLPPKPANAKRPFAGVAKKGGAKKAAAKIPAPAPSEPEFSFSARLDRDIAKAQGRLRTIPVVPPSPGSPAAVAIYNAQQAKILANTQTGVRLGTDVAVAAVAALGLGAVGLASKNPSAKLRTTFQAMRIIFAIVLALAIAAAGVNTYRLVRINVLKK